MTQANKIMKNYKMLGEKINLSNILRSFKASKKEIKFVDSFSDSDLDMIHTLFGGEKKYSHGFQKENFIYLIGRLDKLYIRIEYGPDCSKEVDNIRLGMVTGPILKQFSNRIELIDFIKSLNKMGQI